MKKSFKIYLLLLILATVISCSKSGNQGNDYYWGHGFGMGYGMGSYDDRGQMMSDLGITDQQADKIAGIDEKYRRLYFENRGDYDKINSLRQEQHREIAGVLNDSQRAKFENSYNMHWKNWGRDYGRRHMGGYYGEGYGMGYCSGLYSSSDYMKENLALSDDQVKKIDDTDAKYRDLYYKNRDDYNKIDSLRIEHRKEIEKILTPEQRKKFSDSYDRRWRGWGYDGSRMGHGMMGY